MKNVKDVLVELEKLIGKEFDESDVIIAFNDFTELELRTDEIVTVSKVEGQTSNFDGYGECELYNAYVDAEDSTIFNIYVDDENNIVHVS